MQDSDIRVAAASQIEKQKQLPKCALYETPSLSAPDIPPLTDCGTGPARTEVLEKFVKETNKFPVGMYSASSLYVEHIYLYESGYIAQNINPQCDGPKFWDRILVSDSSFASFPFNAWDKVFRLRARDIQKSMFNCGRDLVYPREGVRIFVTLNYKSTIHPHEDLHILQHAFLVKDIVVEYYNQNLANVDTGMWIVATIPKPHSNSTLNFESRNVRIVFPFIVVDSRRLSQLWTSMRYRFEKKWGIVSLIKPESTEGAYCVRPVYTYKVGKCPICSVSSSCSFCKNSGKVYSGSVYKPLFYVDNKNGVLKQEADIQLEDYHHILSIIRNTSVIPVSDIQGCTPGFITPHWEPLLISPLLRSSEVVDRIPGCVYKQDRRKLNRRAGVHLDIWENRSLVGTLHYIVRGFHENYRYSTIHSVILQSKQIYFDLRNGGRSFCRLGNLQGRRHKKNRIYFKVCLRKGFIEQLCYKDKCCKMRTGPVTTTIRNFILPRLLEEVKLA